MFGIGFGEIVLIGVAVLIFVRPKDLPGFFRRMGALYGQLREHIGAAKQLIEELGEEPPVTDDRSEIGGNKPSSDDNEINGGPST